LAGSTWTLPSMKAKVAVKVGKLKGKDKALEPMTLSLLPGDAWNLESLSFAELGGTYTRKNDSAKKLLLTASTASLQNVADQLEDDIEDSLASEGINATLSLAIAKAKMATGLKIKKKANAVSAKVGLALKFTGSVTVPEGTFGSKISVNAKGVSNPNTLDSITD
jgi:hypothetical protein